MFNDGEYKGVTVTNMTHFFFNVSIQYVQGSILIVSSFPVSV